MDETITGQQRKSADSLVTVEAKRTPEELLASRAALTEHGKFETKPLKQILSEKPEYLHHNQPSVTDLVKSEEVQTYPGQKEALRKPPQRKRKPSPGNREPSVS